MHFLNIEYLRNVSLQCLPTENRNKINFDERVTNGVYVQLIKKKCIFRMKLIIIIVIIIKENKHFKYNNTL